MSLKMDAAVVEQFGKPLTLRQRDIPSRSRPNSGQNRGLPSEHVKNRLFGRPCQLLNPAYHSDSAKRLSPRQRAGFGLRNVTILYRAQ